jgi:hypothetical protein
LRGQKIALRGDFLPRRLPAANSIYPPMADSNGNSGLLAAQKKVPGTKFAIYLTAKSKK